MRRFDFLKKISIATGLGLALVGAPVLVQAQSQDVGRQMEQEYGVLGRDTAEGRRYNSQMDEVVERIVAGVNRTRRRESDGKQFQLKSAKILGGRSDKHDQVINAFALPDGRIYVTLGLLRAIRDSARSDDELAFVVGHEVTHVTERHSAHQSKKATEAGLLALLLGAVTKNRAVETLGQYGAAAYVSSFGRKDEYRADRGGLLAMDAAGYDLNSAATMLNRLKSKGEGQNKLVNGWFGSHPLTSNRVSRVQNMIQELRRGGNIRDRSEKELEREDRKRRR